MVCVRCGSPFEKRRYNQIYCTAICQKTRPRSMKPMSEKQKAHKAKYRAENREKIRASAARWRAANRDKKRAYNAKWFSENREKGRAWNARRRAAISGVSSEPFMLSEIFDRDQGVCALCGSRVSSKLKWPNVGSASVDHIIPIDQGGDNTRANVQLAHLGCNMGKRERTVPNGEQLRLVG